MARPRAGSQSEPPAQSGGGGNGDDPPKRPTATGGAEDPDSIAAAQEKADRIAQRGRASGERALRSTVPPQGPAAKIPLKSPNARHSLNSIRPSSPAKEKNTIVLPGTDVSADLADISAGRATWMPDSNRYEVNGRSYAMESTGTVFPVSGPGFVNLSRSEYKVLKQLIGNDGDISAAQAALRRDPSVSDADWRSALDVFRNHKSYRGEA